MNYLGIAIVIFAVMFVFWYKSDAQLEAHKCYEAGYTHFGFGFVFTCSNDTVDLQYLEWKGEGEDHDR